MADVVAKFKLEDGSELPIGKSFISSLKSVSESTSDAGSINYGTLANSGSIEIQDGNGYISKMIDDGILPVSDIDVNIEVNGNVFQQHITTDSDYNTEDNTLNISLSNFIKDFDILKYKGFQYPDASRTLYEIFVDVLNSYLNTTVANIDSMFDDDVLEYIKNIKIEFPYVEYGKTYREVIDSLCTIAQLNMFITKENKPKFISARPVYSLNKEIKQLTWNNVAGDLKYTKTLKNKFDGVEISSSRPISEVFYDAVVYSEDTLSTTHISQEMNLSEFNSQSGSNRGFDSGRILLDSNLRYATFYLSATKIKNYYVEGDLYINKSANDNLSNILKIKNTLWDADGNPLFVIHYDKYEDSSVSAVINSSSGNASSFNSANLKFVSDGAGYIDQSVTYSFKPSGYTNKATSTATETDSSYISVSLSGDTYKLHYKILCGQDVVYLGGEWSDSYMSIPPTSADVSCYGKFTRYKPKSIEFSLYGNKREISFKEVSSSTENIENKKVKATVRPNNLLQTTTTYNGEKIANVIKSNILNDYRLGISDGKLTLNKDLVEIGDLVKYPNDRRVWRVVGKEFDYDGEYLFPISVMQCLLKPSGYGVYNEDGSLAYDWNDILQNGMVVVEDGTVVSFDQSIEGKLTMPNTITKIGDNAFKSSKLNSIKLPSSLTEIGKSAFYYCSKLTEIDVPDSVTKVGSSAFAICSSLQTASLGSGVASVPDSAFNRCSKLKTVSFKGSITSIGGYAFNECSNIVINIPSTVTRLGDNAFYECKSLTTITVPSGVTYIPEWCFGSCTKLASITLHNNITEIDSYAFEGTAITTITLPSKLTYISTHLFANSKITTVSIPSSVTWIGDYAFENCTGLTSISIPDTVVEGIGQGAFKDCSNLSSVRLPSNLLVIERQIFHYATKLKSITIPSTVQNINEEAFFESGLTSISIPSSVEHIEYNAFGQCWDLSTATIGQKGGSWVWKIAPNGGAFTVTPSLSNTATNAEMLRETYAYARWSQRNYW